MKYKLSITLFAVVAVSAAVFGASRRIAVFGDSITEQGAGIKPWGYCVRLNRAVRNNGLEDKLEFLPLGFGGYLLDTWINLEKKSPKGSESDVASKIDSGFDTIVVFLGMNDILKPSVTDVEATWDEWSAKMKGFTSALRSRTRAKKTVYCTITPLTNDPRSPKNVVREELNCRIRALAAKEGAAVAEMGDRAMKVVEECRKLNPHAQPIPDFVHPGALIHAAFAAEVAKALGETKLAETLENDYRSEFKSWAAKNSKKVSWRLRSHPEESNPKGTLVYEIEVYANGATNVAVSVSKGMKALNRSDEDIASGIVRVSGLCESGINPVELSFFFADGSKEVETVPIPAPWRVSTGFDAPDLWRGQSYLIKEDSHISSDIQLSSGRWLEKPFYVGHTPVKWRIYSGNLDSTGHLKQGAVDPFQTVFGSQYDSLYAVRWVYSPDNRAVIMRLGHETFSATLAVNVWLNGVFYGTNLLDRNGCNRRDVKAALKKGWNLLVLRVDHANWQRQFSCDFLTLDGREMDDLKYSAYPRNLGTNLSRDRK